MHHILFINHHNSRQLRMKFARGFWVKINFCLRRASDNSEKFEEMYHSNEGKRAIRRRRNCIIVSRVCAFTRQRSDGEMSQVEELINCCPRMPDNNPTSKQIVNSRFLLVLFNFFFFITHSNSKKFLLRLLLCELHFCRFWSLQRVLDAAFLICSVFVMSYAILFVCVRKSWSK